MGPRSELLIGDERQWRSLMVRALAVGVAGGLAIGNAISPFYGRTYTSFSRGPERSNS